MSKLIVGLTGGIGSGKTTVTNLFADLGVDIVDADIVARDVVAKGSPALTSISKHFGHDFIQTDGQLDRAKLRERVFSNSEDKDWLNNLLHPLIRKQLVLQTQAASSAYCLLVVPLLIENGLTKLVNRVLVVDVKESTQISRTSSRDNNSKAQVLAIMESQLDRKTRLLHADDVVSNESTSLEELKNVVSKLHSTYMSLAMK
jgi:dephospho-CoA kinase